MTDNPMAKPQPGSLPTPLPIIGILGDGQLSMMMIEAYQAMGGKVFVYGEQADNPASQNADHFIQGSAAESDAEKMEDFFRQVDLVTLENEFIDSKLLLDVSERSGTEIFPSPKQFQLIENKLAENLFFQDLGVKIADFFEVKTEDDLLDVPGYLKLSKGGYDGIGTYRVDTRAQALEVFNRIKDSGTVLFEHQVNFKKELSVIAVTNSHDIAFYPMVETFQESGTCRYVAYPSGVSAEIEQRAQNDVTKIMKALNTRGLFAFEFFLTEDDELVLNESAPRPHNSGHITLDSMDCSQFENHMRAVADLELKHPKAVKPSAMMINLLGTRNGDSDEANIKASIEDQQLTVKLYGKKQSRVKRKMGHINLWGEDQWQRAKSLVNTLEI